MKKFLKYLKSIPAKTVTLYSKTKSLIISMIPQEMKDELNLKGGVVIFAECITFIALIALLFLSFIMFSMLSVIF